MTAWKLSTFQNDSYTYKGISEDHCYYFTTEEKAKAFANEIGKQIRWMAEDTKDCEIEEITIR